MSQIIEDRTIALAGVFQSAAIVQQIARTGEVPKEAFAASIKSIFVLDAPDTESVYGDIGQLKLGLDVLESLLAKKETSRYAESFRYTVGLIHIEKQLRNNEDLLSILRSRLEQTQSLMGHFDDDILHPSVVAKLAALYVDTLGTFNYRIQVKGDPKFLQQDEVANKIRAVFLAGVRSATLWRQLGGSRLQFLLGKRKMVEALNALQQKAQLLH
ncbi:MAG: high frequency lysogenization protein HflD [Pseudomonadales bacterium]|nr:high frequency lysogenization protein HflD [Pseudomonadales bacterium]